MLSKILIVDDSIVDRRLAAGLLERNKDLCISFAENGIDAISILEESTDNDRPDVVLTDMIMPEMDGLELVKAIRKKVPQIPVILMTAHGNEAIASESLRLGAASYVPKSQQNERLLATVEQVLARSNAEKHRQQLFASAQSVVCTFMLESDPALVRPLVDFAQQALSGVPLTDAAGRIRIAIALEEALLNAIYHGALRLNCGEMLRLRAGMQKEDLDELIKRDKFEQKNQSSPIMADRKIIVKMNISALEATFVIRDNGSGFDPVVASGSDSSSRFERGRNRGLTLIRSLSDDLSYNDVGNEVTLRKRRDKPSIAVQPA